MSDGMARVRRAAQMVVVNSVASRFAVPHSVRAKIYRRCGLTVGQWTDIYPRQTIRPGTVTIGRNCVINYGGIFDPGEASISIEDDVFIGVQVLLLAQTHELGSSTKRARGLLSKPISIGRGSWLGARVTVLPGVRVAEGCIIGANSTVTTDTEPNGVYVGSPARRVRDLDE
jgi:maltose O-acetyltransferase